MGGGGVWGEELRFLLFVLLSYIALHEHSRNRARVSAVDYSTKMMIR